MCEVLHPGYVFSGGDERLAPGCGLCLCCKPKPVIAPAPEPVPGIIPTYHPTPEWARPTPKPTTAFPTMGSV